MELAGVRDDSRKENVAKFGPFEFCFQTGELRKLGVRVRLQGKPAHLLRSLIEHHGQVVTREELKDKLWPSDVFVDFESGLNTAANRLRCALGDSAERPLYIETLPKIGYRFSAPVSIVYLPDCSGEDQHIEPLHSLLPEVKQSPDPVQPLSSISGSWPISQVMQEPKPWRKPTTLAMAGCALLAGVLVFHLHPYGVAPSFQQITFFRGYVGAARFTPNGKAVLYSAARSGVPSQVFLVKRASPESKVISEGTSWLAGVSSKGEVALFKRLPDEGRVILSSLPSKGGAAVTLSDHAKSADWAPDGSLCVVLADRFGYSVNYPKDRMLYKSTGWISNVRVAQDGQHVAFLEHPLESDDAGQVVVVDMLGHARVLSSGWASVVGLAWNIPRQEIWFTAARSGINRVLMAVDLKGNVRQVAQVPGGMILQDVNSNGDVLITRTNPRMAMFWGDLQNGSAEDISLLDWSRVVALTRDGRLLLFDESGEGGGKQYSVYLYNSLSKTSQRLGEGRAIDMSPDGRWVLTQAASDPSRLTLISVGQGKSSPVSTEGLTYQWGKFIPGSDCPEIVFAASQTGHSVQLYRQRLPSGKPQVVAREVELNEAIISDGGDLVAGLDAEARLSVLDLRTGTLRSNGISKPSFPVKFMDRTRILTSRYDNGTVFLNVLDTTSGEERLYWRFAITDNTGTAQIFPLHMTEDLKRIAYSQLQPLSDLFTVSGWS